MGKGKRYYFDRKEKKKAILYIAGITSLCILVVLIFTLSIYKNKMDAESQIAKIESIQEQTIDTNEIESASTSEDKSIEEAQDENIPSINTITNETNKIAIKTETSENTVEVEDEEEPKEVVLEFMVPLEGEITKDFSDTTLVYSETLKEWTVHLGIDIKADKGSAVFSSEAGTIESIKNDPRYGLTVTIAHANGFKTIYSNLLSAEFVTEGQTVEKGQTIGSVGSSAVFEIADSEHLHFEMTQNGQTVNPASYWK